MRMTFGKYRGVEIADLDDGYLTWLHDAVDLREPLHSAIEAEYTCRFSTAQAKGSVTEAVRHMMAELVSTGYRKLATLHHPDHGGDTTTMQLVNAADAFLRHAVRKAT